LFVDVKDGGDAAVVGAEPSADIRHSFAVRFFVKRSRCEI
jgi:hypothetical protein